MRLKILAALFISLISLSSFCATEIVKLPIKYKVNGKEKNTVVKIEHGKEGITLIGRGGFKEITLLKDSLDYFTYAYTNGPETGREMRTYKLNSEKTRQEILKFASHATLDCPFVIWKTIYGEISEYEISDCLGPR